MGLAVVLWIAWIIGSAIKGELDYRYKDWNRQNRR